MPAPDLATILELIRADPDDNARWLLLAGWLADNGRDDEAATVRGFWLELRDWLRDGYTVEKVLQMLQPVAWRLAPEVRAAEGRQYLPPRD